MTSHIFIRAAFILMFAIFVASSLSEGEAKSRIVTEGSCVEREYPVMEWRGYAPPAMVGDVMEFDPMYIHHVGLTPSCFRHDCRFW